MINFNENFPFFKNRKYSIVIFYDFNTDHISWKLAQKKNFDFASYCKIFSFLSSQDDTNNAKWNFFGYDPMQSGIFAARVCGMKLNRSTPMYHASNPSKHANTCACASVCACAYALCNMHARGKTTQRFNGSELTNSANRIGNWLRMWRRQSQQQRLTKSLILCDLIAVPHFVWSHCSPSFCAISLPNS